MKPAAQTRLAMPDIALHPALNTQPSKLFVEITTRCNLKCPMCPKQAPGNGIVHGDMRAETFDCIKPALPGLEALILNGISWNGNVHPCYFLWHRYQCYIGGFVKYVQPESFGCLIDQDLLSIWNEPAFKNFRQGVLQYDFPFCYDCSVALCDYTQFEDFEQDCHVSSVPCGACLWCTGLFRCLQ